MENSIILGILAIYLTTIIAIGLYTSRKVRSVKGFFLADRSLGWFSLTATITATTVGGSATIATGALIYVSGLPGIWLDIGGAIGLVILGLTLAKMVRKTGLFTLPEISGFLYDKKVRYAAAILILITQVAWISLLIQAAQAVLYVVFPLNYEILLIIITLIFICYTLIGGQFAVVYTDIIQFIVMIIGVCIIATPIIFMQASDIFGNISVEHLSFPVNTSIGVLPVFSFFFMMLMPHIVGPDIYSKILSAKNEKTAKQGAILSGIFKFIFAIAVGIIALSAVVLYPNLENASLAIPTAILSIPPVFAGFVLAAFISVMLSSADSVLLSSGTVISIDITQKKNIIVSRFGILIVGLLALALALYLKDIIDTLKLAYTVFTSGLTFPIIFGFYNDKTHVTSNGAFFSLIFGGGISLIWFFIGSPYIDAVLIGMVFSLVPLLILREKKIKK